MGNVAGQWSVSIAVAFTFAVIVSALYREFASNWPENYFGASNSIDPVVSRSLSRYTAFRLGPVFLALVAAGCVSDRLGGDRGAAIWLTTMMHLGHGVAPELLRALKRAPPLIGLGLVRAGTALGVVGCASLAVVLDSRLDEYIPTGQEAASALWIGLAVLALGRVAKILTGTNRSPAQLAAAAERRIKPHLLRELRTAGPALGPAAVAIAMAEELNRPKWVRRVEVALVRREGSYGLMQMKSLRPLGDEASVRQFLDMLGPEYPPLPADPSPQGLRDFFLAHNDDANFADLATALYWHLRARP